MQLISIEIDENDAATAAEAYDALCDLLSMRRLNAFRHDVSRLGVAGYCRCVDDWETSYFGDAERDSLTPQQRARQRTVFATYRAAAQHVGERVPFPPPLPF